MTHKPRKAADLVWQKKKSTAGKHLTRPLSMQIDCWKHQGRLVSLQICLKLLIKATDTATKGTFATPILRVGNWYGNYEVMFVGKL